MSGIPDELHREVFDVMERADWHTFQVLTKRHERLAELAPRAALADNVWMGVSIENRRFVHRADYLRRYRRQCGSSPPSPCWDRSRGSICRDRLADRRR